MIKVVMTWKRNPRRTLEECERHYLDVHTRLAMASIDKAVGMVAYVQNRVVDCQWHNFNQPEAVAGVPDFDRYVELYYESEAAMQSSFETADMQSIFADQVNFMDTEIEGSLRVYRVEETVVFGGRT
jgi:uncharacterized protein (TIGR02118 family)